MSQSAITRILDIERSAVQIHDNARRQAEDIVGRAQGEASSLREHLLGQARDEAGRIVAEAQCQAEAGRAKVLSQAEAETRSLETTAAQHLERAVEFVLDRITERG